MEQLLLSSQRLNTQKVLSTGTINLTEELQKNEVENRKLEIDLPQLELEWKEVATPPTGQGLRDLVGKKMNSYKFQYLGQFRHDGTLINAVAEEFTAGFDQETIHHQRIESNGWINCTWLVDLIMNPNSNDKLFWRKEGDRLVFSLSTHATDHTSAEQQKISFSEDMEQVTWEHKVLFYKK